MPAASNLPDYAKSLSSDDSIKLSLSETTYFEAVEGFPSFDQDAFEQYSKDKLRQLQTSDSESQSEPAKTKDFGWTVQ